MENRKQIKNRFDDFFNFSRAGSYMILMFAVLITAFSVGIVACGDDPAPTAPDPGDDIEVTIEGVVVDASESQIILEGTEKAGQAEVAESDNPEDLRSGWDEREISDERETIPVETDMDDERASLKTEGDPIEGAEVSVYLPGTENPIKMTTTNADGTYELSFTVSGDDAPNELRLEVEADGFEPYETTLSFSTSISYDIELGSKLEAVCEDVELGVNYTDPLSYTEVYGITDDFGAEPGARMYDAALDEPEDDELVRIYLERTGGEAAEVMIPFHLSDWRAGGHVEVVIFSEDGLLVCPGLELEVGPLEPAPGTRQAMVDEMESKARDFAEEFGQDPDELIQEELLEVDPWLQGVAILLKVIDGPEYSNNMHNLLSGDAPIYDGEPIDEETEALFDAIFAESGIAEKLVDMLSELLEHSEVFDGENPVPPTENTTSSSRSDIRAAALVEIEPEDEYVTPDRLDILMSFQDKVETLNSGVSGELQEFAEIAAGTTSASVAMIPGGQLTAAQIGLAGNALNALGLALDVGDNLFPQRLGAIELSTAPTEYNNEDDDEIGEWEAPLYAETNEWTLEWDDALGGIPGFGPALKVLTRIASPITKEFVRNIGQETIEQIWGQSVESGPVTIKEFKYHIISGITPPRENEENYFTWELRTIESETGNAPFVFVNDEDEYAPNAVGISELRVRTRDGRFKDQDRVDNVFLTLEKIEVDIIRPGVIVDNVQVAPEEYPPFIVSPSEEIELFADVQNSLYPDSVEWEKIEPNPGILIVPGGGRQAFYTAPEEPGQYGIRVEHTGRQGARSDGDPPRTDLARVIVGDFNVTPDPICLGLEETIDFSATFAGDEVPFEEVQHTFIEGTGSLSSDGEFAPGGPGDIAIEFEYFPPELNDPLIDEVSFTVVDKPICTYIELKAGGHNVRSECAVGGINNDGKFSMTNDGFPEIPGHTDPDDFLIGLSAFEVPQKGEWRLQFENEVRRDIIEPNLEYIRHVLNWETGFQPDAQNSLELWSAPGWIQEERDIRLIGNQTVTIRREIVEVGGEEIALFSGEATGLIFYLFDPIPGVPTMGGSIRFGGLHDVTHVPMPSQDQLCGIWATDLLPDPSEWPDF